MMVTKPCPKCKEHLPVACKACPCGHVFFVARRPISIHKVGRMEEGEGKRRRTERTKRERPDYFNSLQVENQWKKLKSLQKNRQRTENSTSSSTNDVEGEGSNSEEGSNTNASSQTQTSGGGRQKRRGRPKKSYQKPAKEDNKNEKEVDCFANLSEEKELQFSIILAEINRKMWCQKFRP